MALQVCLLAALVLVARPASAHPAPFSYIDVRIGDGPIHGRMLVVDCLPRALCQAADMPNYRRAFVPADVGSSPRISSIVEAVF